MSRSWRRVVITRGRPHPSPSPGRCRWRPASSAAPAQLARRAACSRLSAGGPPGPRAVACLTWRNGGSWSSRPCSGTMNAPHADAAHADDLPCEVDGLDSLHRDTESSCRRTASSRGSASWGILSTQPRREQAIRPDPAESAERDDGRRLGSRSGLCPSTRSGQLQGRPEAVQVPGLSHCSFSLLHPPFLLLFLFPPTHQTRAGCPPPPGPHVRSPSYTAARLTFMASRCAAADAVVTARTSHVEAVVAAGDGKARCHPLHVVLERPRKRLVE